MKKPAPPIHATLNDGPARLLENASSGSVPPILLMTVAEAATFLTISKSGLRRLQQARQLPFIKVGGSVRFAHRDLLAYLAARRVEPLDL